MSQALSKIASTHPSTMTFTHYPFALPSLIHETNPYIAQLPPLQQPRAQPTEMPPPSSTLPSRKRKLAAPLPSASPVPSSPSVSENSGDARDAEYEPVSQPPVRGASKRSKAATTPAASSSARGGSSTATTGRGMSREALRKANHSLIERRRREKINFALGELRDMVPGLGDAEGGKGGEFKLEVLERTVIHMKELKAHIVELEARPLKSPTNSHTSSSSSNRIKSKSSSSTISTKKASPPIPSKPILATLPDSRTSRHPTGSPPTPGQSPDPDPNETDAESNLPPPLTVASRPTLPETWSNHSSPVPTQSITSLLASVPDRSQPQVPTTRPPASSHAYNPTLYLPFPTPSPTSPFLSYSHGSSASSGPPEPSPFLAPMHGMALFGGALTLDHNVLAPSPANALAIHNPSAGKDKGRTSKEQEDAANVLLAFSSPDVMRPVGYMTPLVVPADNGPMQRRGTLDSEEFVLDGGVLRSGDGGRRDMPIGEVRGKTARDILRM